MADRARRPSQTPPRGPLAADHPRHDLLLVAARAADDLAGPERDRADAQLAACPDCRALAADLRALAAATASLPPPTLVRPRDFRLTPGDAARLRPAGWRRVLAALAAPRSLARPLAATFTTLGLAGLLLAALPSISLFGSGGSAALAPVGRDMQSAATLGPSAAASMPAASAGQAYGGDTGGEGRLSPLASSGGGNAEASGGKAADQSAGVPGPVPAAPTGTQPAPPLVLVSGSLLVVGIGLFGLRWAGRRLAPH